MRAKIGLDLKPGTRNLVVERYGEFWLLPTNANTTNTLGTFIRLYNNGRVERVYIHNEPPYEDVVLIKPEDNLCR